MSSRPSYHLKVERADAHLKDVHSCCAKYLDSHPYEIRPDKNPDTGLTFWITLLKRLPDHVALAAGDCVHNLRSALDHVVYAFSQRLGGDEVQGTEFPIILQDEKKWDAKACSGTLKSSSGLYKVRGLPQPAIDFIERMQPYHGLTAQFWQRRGLRDVHVLDIIDKHRKLNMATTVVDLTGYGHDGSVGPLIEAMRRGTVLEEETESLLLRFDPSVDLEVEVEPHAFLQIAFGDYPVKGSDLLGTLDHLRTGVVSIVNQLVKLCDGRPLSLFTELDSGCNSG